jgi:cytoskeletal protein RodZ
MDGTCTSCRAVLRPGQGFCANCGLSVAPAHTTFTPAPERNRSGSRPAYIVLGVAAVVVVAAAAIWFTGHRQQPTVAIATPTPTGASTVQSTAPDPTGTDPDPAPADPTDPALADPTDPDLDPTPADDDVSAPPVTGSADGLVTIDPATAQAASPDVAAGVVRVFDTYFAGINAGRPQTAYAVFSARERAKNPYLTWRSNIAHSRNENVSVSTVSGAVSSLAGGPVTVEVSFRSHQPGSKGVNPGETCTDWSLVYTLIPNAGGSGYLINSAKVAADGGHSAC